MVSILCPHIDLDVYGSIIDCSWFYGCLFSPTKIVRAILRAGVDDNPNHHLISEDEKIEHLVVDRDGRNKEIGINGSPKCFRSTYFDSAKVWREDAVEETKFVASMFKVLDEDGDGRVSADEMMRLMDILNLEMAKDEVELALRSISACGDQFLTYMEFGEFYRVLFTDREEETHRVKVEDQAISEAFSVFDKNGDGFISGIELADVLSRLGFAEGKDMNRCESMIERVDFNGDGLVDIHEFRHLITTPSLSAH